MPGTQWALILVDAITTTAATAIAITPISTKGKCQCSKSIQRANNIAKFQHNQMKTIPLSFFKVLKLKETSDEYKLYLLKMQHY